MEAHAHQHFGIGCPVRVRINENWIIFITMNLTLMYFCSFIILLSENHSGTSSSVWAPCTLSSVCSNAAFVISIVLIITFISISIRNSQVKSNTTNQKCTLSHVRIPCTPSKVSLKTYVIYSQTCNSLNHISLYIIWFNNTCSTNRSRDHRAAK